MTRLPNKWFFIIGLIILFASCEVSGPDAPHEEEVITTLTYTLTSTETPSHTVKLYFQDKDGSGGNAPIKTISDSFLANTTYKGTFSLLNEQKTPTDDITKEINSEKEEHQFFFQFTPGTLGLAVSYSDTDGNAKPVGLKTTLTTGAKKGTDSLTITLRHNPIKSADKVDKGIITNAGGETDIQVGFRVYVK